VVRISLHQAQHSQYPDSVCFKTLGLRLCLHFDSIVYLIKSVNTLRAGVQYIRTTKPVVVGGLTNAISPPPIVLESCLRAQTDQPVF